MFTGEDSGHCTSYSKAETLSKLICEEKTTLDDCDTSSALNLAGSPGKGEKWAGTFCCPVFEAIDGTYPHCTWPRNARYADGAYIPHGPFDKCAGKRSPLPESAGAELSYLVEPALAKIWCGYIESEAECKAKDQCVWQYKELTCKKSDSPAYWDRGGVVVMANPEGACSYPGCWGEDDER